MVDPGLGQAIYRMILEHLLVTENKKVQVLKTKEKNIQIPMMGLYQRDTGTNGKIFQWPKLKMV